MESRTLPVTPTRTCRCTKTHSPRALVVHQHHIHPLGHGGPDVKSNLIWLCPTTHYNVHYLLDYLLRHGHQPRGRFSTYQLDLARRGYEAILQMRKS